MNETYPFSKTNEVFFFRKLASSFNEKKMNSTLAKYPQLGEYLLWYIEGSNFIAEDKDEEKISEIIRYDARVHLN